jgi:hypothetical protein
VEECDSSWILLLQESLYSAESVTPAGPSFRYQADLLSYFFNTKALASFTPSQVELAGCILVELQHPIYGLRIQEISFTAY